MTARSVRRAAALTTYARTRYAQSMRRVAVLALLLGACGSRSTERPEDPLERTVEAIRASGFIVRNAGVLDRRLAVTVTRDGVRIAASAVPGISITLEDERGADRRDRASIALRREVAPHTDVVEVTTPGGFETFHVLHQGALPRVRLRVRTGSDVALLRVREQRIELVSTKGRVELGSAPIVAHDARGRLLPTQITLGEGMLTISVDDRDAARPLVVDPLWSTLPVMASRRARHSATRLLDGKVLVAGGATTINSGEVVSAELFDPATNTWSTVGSMNHPRHTHAAVLLPSGKVMVAGSTSSYSQVEIFDLTTKTWSDVGTITPRGLLSMAVLPSGKVLVAGGASATMLSLAELYDPATGVTTPLPSSSARHGEAATATLPSGKIFVGGSSYSPPNERQVDLFDPSTSTWTAPSLVPSRTTGRSALLPNGKLLVAGNVPSVYDEVSNTWTNTGAPTVIRNYAYVAPLGNGKVLMAGGCEELGSENYYTSAEIYDPASNTWTATESMAIPRAHGTATPLLDGRVLITGGEDADAPLSTAEIYALPVAANGVACTSSFDCVSSYCVDGVCCNAPCTESCKACDVTPGTCTAVTGAPHGARSCAPYATCNAGTCSASCVAHADCVSTSYCAVNACVTKKSTGAVCANTVECASGFCVDGVCCDRACGGQCAACNVTGSVGTCKATKGPPAGARAACTGTGLGTPCGPACNGADEAQCHFALVDVTACSANACAAGVETHANTCDGAGGCRDVPKSCGVYACGATVCKTSCAANADCASGHWCKSGVCAPLEGLGTPCTNGTGCATGACTDSVCCDKAECGPGNACDLAGSVGKCAGKVGSPCSVADTCASGFCADGVCCSTACAGQCEACDLAGGVGTCTAVSGAPRGARPPCSAPAAEPCAAKVCDGAKDTSACVAYANGPTTTCKVAACDGAKYVAPSTCDGAGGCVAPTAASCVPFGCSANGCLDRCTADAECAAGYRCKSDRCIAEGAECAGEGTASVARDGTRKECAPYRCSTTGECATSCSATTDCAAGYLCDATGKSCIAPPQSEDSGGCAMGRRSGTAPYLAMVALLALSLRRRSAPIR